MEKEKATRNRQSGIVGNPIEIEDFIKEMDKENRERKSRIDPLVPELGLRAMLESRLLLT